MEYVVFGRHSVEESVVVVMFGDISRSGGIGQRIEGVVGIEGYPVSV